MIPTSTSPHPATTSPARQRLAKRMTRPQRHRLLHGYPLAAAMPRRHPGLPADVRPDPARRLIVGVLPHPFCNPTVEGCGYCTFAHEKYHGGRAAATVERVAREVRDRTARFPGGPGRPVDALYFGGGTANLSPVEPFRRLCRTLAESFDLRGAEVTLEGVPAYFLKGQPNLMDVMREEIPARHFRVSMGVQTFDTARLRQMGRQAFGDAATFAAVVEAAHDRGFTASADLLFNLPHQTLAEMRRDLDRADALGLDHLGLYHLVLFHGLGTAWARDPKMLAGLPGNDAAADNWLALHERLLGGGWNQTTLTNFERASFRDDPRRFVYEERSFRLGEYDALGFGPGGISFAADPDLTGGLKLLNPTTADDYSQAVDRGDTPWDRYFQYSPDDLRVFHLTRRLAALEIDTGEYRRLFGSDPYIDFPAELAAAHHDANLIEFTDTGIRPTPRGMFFADAVASLFLRRPVATVQESDPTAPAADAEDNGFGHM